MGVEGINEIITDGGVWSYKNIKVDFSTYTAFVNGIKTEMTYLNMELLKLFLPSKGKIITRNIIKDRIWGEDSLVSDRNIDFQICVLRKKLGMSKYELISIRSVGYKLILK